MHAAVRLDHTLLAVDGEHDVHGMLELVAPEAPDDGARAPLSLSLVLDRSGSMAGEKLEVAKRCARWLVSQLRPEDEIAIVDYDEHVRLLAPRAPVEAPALQAALDRIWPGGTTNLSGGWLKGLEQLRGCAAERARKILLLTDGLANVGVTDPEALVALTRTAAKRAIGTTTIGLGDDFDEDLLTAMADAGGGNAHYAPTADAAPAIFAAEADGLATLVAQNVSVEIRPAPEVEIVAVLNDFPAVAVPGGIQLALGDAYGGDRRRVVLALHIPHLVALGPVKVAELVVRYVSIGDEIAEHDLTVPVVANAVSAAGAAAAAPDAEVEEEVVVLKSARAGDEAIGLADDGDFDGAKRLLRQTADEVRGAARRLGPAKAAALEQEAADLEDADALVAPVSYLASGAPRKHLRYASNQRRRKRL